MQKDSFLYFTRTESLPMMVSIIRIQILGRIDQILVAQGQELVAAFVEKRNRELALMQLQQRLQLQELIRLLTVSRDLDEHPLRLRLRSVRARRLRRSAGLRRPAAGAACVTAAALRAPPARAAARAGDR